MEKIQTVLQKHNVDFERGFLPSEDPLRQLSESFAPWENLAENFTEYINAGIIRAKIDAMALIENPDFKTKREAERGMLLLSFFAHAYIHCLPESRKFIPASVAVPWVKTAKTLNRKPILSHASVVLNNWKRLDENKPIRLDNLATLCQFHGGQDESWFYLVTAEIEQIGAKAIPIMLKAMENSETGLFEESAKCLSLVGNILKELLVSLRKMYERCDPYIFYLRVRPFLSSFEKIEYRGTGLPPQNIHGGSAAQSSLIQFFDAALGMDYPEKSTENYLLLMRQHMPSEHAAFLEFTEQNSTLKANSEKNKNLRLAYRECIQKLIDFRNEHLKIVALYIMKQAKKMNASTEGTGGTNPMIFLKSVRNRNIDLSEKF